MGKFSRLQIDVILLNFFPEIDFDISCKLSPKERRRQFAWNAKTYF